MRPEGAALPTLLRALVATTLLAPSLAAGQPVTSPYDHDPIRYHLDASNLTLTTWWYKMKVRQAFDFWEEGGNGALEWTPRFEEVPRDQDPDIVLWFRDADRVGETCGNSTDALGCARAEPRPGARSADGSRGPSSGPPALSWSIEIKTRRAGDGQHYSYGLIGDVAKHEVGHALGLGHAPDPRDIMFASTDTTVYADAQPIGEVKPILIGVAVLLLLILGSVIVIARVARRRDEEEAPSDALPPPRRPPDG